MLASKPVQKRPALKRWVAEGRKSIEPLGTAWGKTMFRNKGNFYQQSAKSVGTGGMDEAVKVGCVKFAEESGHHAIV